MTTAKGDAHNSFFLSPWLVLQAPGLSVPLELLQSIHHECWLAAARAPYTAFKG